MRRTPARRVVPPSTGHPTDLDHLCAALVARPTWTCVVLRKNTKRPEPGDGGDGWVCTREPDAVRAAIVYGFNLGILAGEGPGLAVVDVDDGDGFSRLVETLGPLAPSPTVITASGKAHYWMQWTEGIPATLLGLDGEVIGEPRRGERERGQVPAPWQQAACPPSRVVTVTADFTPEGVCRPVVREGAYHFTDGLDLLAPLPRIPPAWLAYFATVQSRVRPARAGAPPSTPPVVRGDRVALHAAALAQPGATVRSGDDVKFVCAGCARGGWDWAQDNARYFAASGTWGCAVYPRGVPGSLDHWIDIGVALGAFDAAVAACLRQRRAP